MIKVLNIKIFLAGYAHDNKHKFQSLSYIGQSESILYLSTLNP